MNTPNNVRRVKASENLDIDVGSLLATDGAWDRKYLCTENLGPCKLPLKEIHVYRGWRREAFHPVRSYIIKMKYLGRFLADGTSSPAKRNSVKEIIVSINAQGEKLLTVNSGLLYRIPQCHVVAF